MTRVEIAEDADALSRAVAERVARLTTAAIRERGRCTIALSGGSTPKGVYRVLAADPLRASVVWDQIEVFWGDERHVPIDHPDSNYRMAAETLLSRVPIHPNQIHRIHGELPNAALAAEEYEAEIRTAVGETDSTPRFDVMLLGLGADGHTASLFPGTTALDEQQRLCVANWVGALGADRITMTLPLINAARTVVFMVSGAEKASIVREVLRGTRDVPARRVQPPDGDLWWMLDRAAAR